MDENLNILASWALHTFCLLAFFALQGGRLFYSTWELEQERMEAPPAYELHSLSAKFSERPLLEDLLVAKAPELPLDLQGCIILHLQISPAFRNIPAQGMRLELYTLAKKPSFNHKACFVTARLHGILPVPFPRSHTSVIFPFSA